MVGSLLLTLAVAGCGSASSLEEGVPEEATEFVPAPKIDFSKPKKHSSKSTAPKPAPAPEAAPE